ncbi:MAG: hypothetical protein JWM78_2634 [Verrucomicrobiaceae bacterium]|nr:hypothetical protein [Verrucomicrobiaceae bacterium]
MNIELGCVKLLSPQNTFTKSIAVAISALLMGFAATVHAENGTGAVHIHTLSTQPNLISGGDVLVRVDLPLNAKFDDVQIKLNSDDITSAFVADKTTQTLTGLVSGLRLGKNKLAAQLNGKEADRLTLTNYPLSGPIISGPHQKPFVCTGEQFKIYSGVYGIEPIDDTTLGAALDENCSAKTKITYLYLPTNGNAFKPLPSTTELPADVAKTTTLNGATVNFIVRVETATIDRGIYQSTILHDPISEPAPSWRMPPQGWNKRLIAVEGGGCPGGWYQQGTIGGSIMLAGVAEFSLFNISRLGEGYALFGNTLQNASQNCNAVLAGEAALMSKEHFIETFGVPSFTVSAGASGGSYGSSQLADVWPGLFDGILISSTFPDPLGIAFSGADGHLLTHYFSQNPDALTPEQQVAISGYKNMKAFIDAANQAGRIDPVAERKDIDGYKSAAWSPAVPASVRYDSIKNPSGARPTLFDAAKAIYGIDKKTGFARSPFDNVGVQYGLAALNSGVITAQQFLDLNKKVGGYDHDFNYVQKRVVGDIHAIRRAYQSGLQLSGAAGLAAIPVFDISGTINEDAGYHYQWFHFAQRERMASANGDANNHVMWRGNPVPFADAWSTFIDWVAAVNADSSLLSVREKTQLHKPQKAIDGCWKSANEFIAEPQSFGRLPSTQCNALFPSYAFPRFIAGGPLAADIIKCQLKPIDKNDYAVAFTANEFKKLSEIFSQGVCDWSKPGVAQTRAIPRASYGPVPENFQQ